ncbi:ATP-binding protein [Hippea alviniae]|uniref:ATP-binding protein n=1 Tax=Hippea alviniae TaxID=1279027 RepID=UPI0003B58AC7|nr:AAA family ATPase [Hippea alviniae]
MFDKIKYYSSLFLSSKVPEYKRSIYHKIDFKEKIIGLKGAKGVGKTTIIHQYLNSVDIPLNEKLYVSLDNPIVEEYSLLDIVEIAYKKGVKLIAFDEIHHKKDFERELKSIYDFFDIQVVFSGSSAIALSSSDLSRRAVIYDIPVLSLREFLELRLKDKFDYFDLESILNNHEKIAFDIISKIRPLKYFEEYIKFGAYPFFLESSQDTYILKLLEVINKTIESELLYLFNIDIKNIHSLKKLLVVLCENPPGSFNITALSREIGINLRTLYNYIEALHKGKLIHLLYYNKKGNAILQKPDKVLLDNPNLFNVLCQDKNIGATRESFFVSQLNEYNIRYSKYGDYIIDDKYVFEIGGKRKTKRQIKNIKNSYLVIDDEEIGSDNRIPLWLFGFLY